MHKICRELTDTKWQYPWISGPTKWIWSFGGSVQSGNVVWHDSKHDKNARRSIERRVISVQFRRFLFTKKRSKWPSESTPTRWIDKMLTAPASEVGYLKVMAVVRWSIRYRSGRLEAICLCCSGSLVVSILAFNSDDPCSKQADVNSFFLYNLFSERTKIIKMTFLKKKFYCAIGQRTFIVYFYFLITSEYFNIALCAIPFSSRICLIKIF